MSRKSLLAEFSPLFIWTKYLLCITRQALRPGLVFPDLVLLCSGTFFIWPYSTLLDSGHAPLPRPILVPLILCHRSCGSSETLTTEPHLVTINNTHVSIPPCTHAQTYAHVAHVAHTHAHPHTITLLCYCVKFLHLKTSWHQRRCVWILHSDSTVEPLTKRCRWNSCSTPSCPEICFRMCLAEHLE